MKGSIAVAAIGLLSVALAQPHRARHAHQDKHEKRVVVNVVNTLYAVPTERPEVIVWVDENGKPVATSEAMVAVEASVYSSGAPSTIAPPSTSSSSTSSSTYSAPSTTSTSISSTYSAPASSSAASSSSSAAAPSSFDVKGDGFDFSFGSSGSSSSSGSEGSGFGFSYSPYNADNSCKTQDQVNTDFAAIPSGYSMVRTYGTDCNQVSTVLNAAKSKGMKLFAGVFDLNSLSSEIATIVAAANGDWSSFDTINIGNELVNSGTASASQVVQAIGTARGLLSSAGYTGKVVTVDTLVAARANPSLCDSSDYCAVNCHPFFDGNWEASKSGEFLEAQIPTLRAVLSNQNQNIVITETGWPWKGQTNGKAVPSPSNQEAAISSIKSSFSSNPENVILFTTFNDMWKTNNAAQFEAEQYWGFLGNSPSG